MTLSENTSAYAVAGLDYYSYSAATTTENSCGTTNNDNTWNEIVFSNLDTLHRLAKQYDSTNQLQLTLQFIRREKYGDGNWNIVAGEINQNFVEFVRTNNPYIYNFFKRSSLTILDYDNSPIDFLHLCATMNGIIVGGGTYWKSLIVGQTHVRNLAGSACRYYYNNIDIPGTGWTSRANLRFSQFFGSDTKSQFSNTVANYTKQTWKLGVEWPIYKNEATRRNITLQLTNNQSNAAKDAFTDYIWLKYQSEL